VRVGGGEERERALDVDVLERRGVSTGPIVLAEVSCRMRDGLDASKRALKAAHVAHVADHDFCASPGQVASTKKRP